MTDKQLKRLSKIELLELLAAQREENDELLKENAELREKLEDRNLILQESGSIAEAALRLTDIFTTAQRAADLYLENVKKAADSNRGES